MKMVAGQQKNKENRAGANTMASLKTSFRPREFYGMLPSIVATCSNKQAEGRLFSWSLVKP
jgi:hypothetical protein